MEVMQILYEKFKLTSFRLGQKEIINDLLKNKNVLAMLPTGSGKSLCYQLPAFLLHGVTIVVSPLLSLMEDQVQQLKSQGIKEVVALNSFLSNDEREIVMKDLHKHKIIYVSPEILQSRSIQNHLKNMKISLFVVDEAHCISQWGHEFRTDYLKLNEVRGRLGNPTCLAITATATKEVQQDIIEKLNLTSFESHIFTVDRPNISIVVKDCGHLVSEKINELVYLAKNLQGPGIIYASSRKWTEDLASILRKEGVKDVSFYHGGMNNDDRLLIQQQFINDELRLICCTSAFGMGINKPNIRYVIHFHAPLQLESYLQEIGRAGRDKRESIAVTLFSESDLPLHMNLLTMEFPNEEQIDAIFASLESNHRFRRINENELLTQTGTSEIMWRFIRFHLEEHGVMIDYKYKRHSITIEDLKTSLKDKIKDRITYKQNKFKEFQQWLSNHTGCRRETILAQFNETLIYKPQKCCDVCGIDLHDYFTNESTIKSLEFQSWQEELKKIFHQ